MPPVFHSAVTSGIRAGLEYDTNRFGKDYRRITFANPEQCQTECYIDNSCQAWSVDKKFKAHLAAPRRSRPLHGERGTARRELVPGAAGVPWRDEGGYTRHGNTQRGERHLHGTHIASEAPRHGVGLGERVDLLASTGRRDGGWVCSKFQMPEDLADHLALRDGGDDPQRPALTKRAACHIQRKDALEQPRPAPARRRRCRVSCSSTPCWRGVGMIAPRRWLCGARQPP